MSDEGSGKHASDTIPLFVMLPCKLKRLFLIFISAHLNIPNTIEIRSMLPRGKGSFWTMITDRAGNIFEIQPHFSQAKTQFHIFLPFEVFIKSTALYKITRAYGKVAAI
jgi:hypothetical protein